MSLLTHEDKDALILKLRTLVKDYRREITEFEMQVKELRMYEVAKNKVLVQLRDRVAELEAQNASLTETINTGTDHCDECGRKLRERITELEAAIDDIAGYATIETPQAVIDIIKKTAR
jgi:chromosome segregation ATPase